MTSGFEKSGTVLTVHLPAELVIRLLMRFGEIQTELLDITI